MGIFALRYKIACSGLFALVYFSVLPSIYAAKAGKAEKQKVLEKLKKKAEISDKVWVSYATWLERAERDITQKNKQVQLERLKVLILQDK
jgi:hypothetical protein